MNPLIPVVALWTWSSPMGQMYQYRMSLLNTSYYIWGVTGPSLYWWHKCFYQVLDQIQHFHRNASLFFFRNAILIHWIIWIKAFNCIAWSSSGDQVCSALLTEQWIDEWMNEWMNRLNIHTHFNKIKSRQDAECSTMLEKLPRSHYE